MAPLLIFHHRPERTVLHRLDPRTKLLLMLAAAAAAFLLPGRGLALLGALLPAAYAAGRLHPATVARNGLAIWVLVALVFLSRAAGTPGDPVLWGTVTRQGLLLGGRDAGRLVFLVFLGHLFIAVTPVSDLQRAVRFFAGPRTALLAGLAVALIPELMDWASETAAAGSLRGLSPRRRPVAALVILGSSLVRKTAERAASTAEALEARNFRYDRSWKPLRPGVPDLAAAALFIVAAAGAALI